MQEILKSFNFSNLTFKEFTILFVMFFIFTKVFDEISSGIKKLLAIKNKKEEKKLEENLVTQEIEKLNKEVELIYQVKSLIQKIEELNIDRKNDYYYIINELKNKKYYCFEKFRQLNKNKD